MSVSALPYMSAGALRENPRAALASARFSPARAEPARRSRPRCWPTNCSSICICVDGSRCRSKWLGETEKNLARIFEAAERSGAILLFDEADAFFGKRSEVKDSHDRYANIEVSYLLQRMESYRGLAILTTNMKTALDTAFLRRIRFIVQFPFPDAAQRAEIWRRILPAETPTEQLDMEKLARLNVPAATSATSR